MENTADYSSVDQNGLHDRLSSYLVFRDPAMGEALADVPRFARSQEPVLLQGETGTGKELVARALHGLGPRAHGPFVAVNCGAIPDTMLEAELFGYEKGAFTGASRTHRGRFEQAHQGTLFLDEIGEMPPTAQVSLLQVLEGQVQRIGGEREISVDVRVVAATLRPLEERVESGLFRQDLLYRLQVLPVQLPPLRDRPRDIGLLARRFLSQSLQGMGWVGATPTLNDAAVARLQTYAWPGNVRELRNMMARLAIRVSPELDELGPDWFDTLLSSKGNRNRNADQGVWIPSDATLAEAEFLLIQEALRQTGNNRRAAAKRLGMGERTLRRHLNSSKKP